jgi:hypothetical protein
MGEHLHGFMGGLMITRRGHDYVFVVVDKFTMMIILMLRKNSIKVQYETIMLFENI